jgi:hypothetical protein
MQIRARPKSPWWHKIRPVLTLLLLAPPLLMFSFSTLFRGKEQQDRPSKQSTSTSLMVDVSTTTTMIDHRRPTLIYLPVRSPPEESNSDDDRVLRYAAWEERADGSTQSVSIELWASLMAHKDTSYAQELALNLTNILKVRHVLPKTFGMV